MTDPAGWRRGTLGALFQGKVAAPLHCYSSSASPGAGFFSSCFCSVDGVSQCQGSGSFCSLPFCSGGGGNGIRKGGGWAPLLSVPTKASRQTLPPAVAQADTPREGLSDHLLSSSSDAASSSLGLQLGVAVSPVPHLSSSTRSKVEVWGTSQGDGVPQHSAMAPRQWQEAVEVGHS